MFGERTDEGWEARLRIHDPSRWFGAPFLMVWLCGWAVGEGFALWILVRGAIALLTGTPLKPGQRPLEASVAVMVGAFLLLWLSFWTLGGVAAIGELLRLLFGEDRILVSGGRLTVTWSRGPLRRTRSFERDAIGKLMLTAPRDTLVLESGGRRVELSRLGTKPERASVLEELKRELAITDAPPDGSDLPEPWEETITPEGERALVPNLGTRRLQARVASATAMVAAMLTFVVARDIPSHVGLIVPAVIGFIVTAAIAAGAVWLARGRKEWRIGSGRLTLRRRFGADVRDEFEARRLVIDASSDSDGDSWYALYAVGEGDAVAPAKYGFRPVKPPNSRTVTRIMNEPQTVRDLGAWLARATGLELEDRSTAAARAIQMSELMDQLEKTGPFGRWAAKWVKKLDPSNRSAS